MKYALKNTAYRPDTETVEELYLRADNSVYMHSKLLSDAVIFNSLQDATDFIDVYKAHDCKIVQVDEKELFEARLTGK